MSRKSPEILVPFVALLYTSAYLFYLVLSAVSPPLFLVLIFGGFGLIFLVSALLVWRKSRVGFVLGIVMSVVFLAALNSSIISSIENPTSTSDFVGVVTAVPALVATVIYSVLGFVAVRQGMAAPGPRRMIPTSSVVALLVVGFVIGGLLVGAFAAGTETRLLGNVGKSTDVVMVSGASTQGNPAGYFSPATYTVSVGQTVTWANADGATHTVTSTSVPAGAKSFDSGDIAPGGQFSVTFTVPGTYQYHCTIHSWMTGTVVVTAA